MTEQKILLDTHIDQVAATLCQRGWQTPALLLLETGRPLAFIGGQLIWLLQPALSLFWSATDITHMAQILETPAELDALITRLEAIDA